MKKKSLFLFFLVLLISSCTSLKQTTFFKAPLLNEFGEKIPTNHFRPKSTEDFTIKICGIIIKPDKPDFEFMFKIKNKDIKLEYVKVQSVVPNDVLTFIDETQKNKHSNPNIKVTTKIIKEKNLYAWYGVASNVSNVIYDSEAFHKYLFKFTIKPVGKPEVIIYQPCILPVFIFNIKESAKNK